jgi:hypothetical protein
MYAGAPEIIIKRCDKYAGDAGVEQTMDDIYMDSFECAYEYFGEQVLEVLPLAKIIFHRVDV